MSDILCVTNRLLCREDFLTRIKKIAACRPAGIILREKDLPETEYKALAAEALDICREYQIPCMLHTFVNAALELNAEAIHLPMPVLRSLSPEQKGKFRVIGASCHSAEEAKEAQDLGCTYVTAGHIFATDCKKGLPGRGLDFLREVCRTVFIPVYAIGGISPENVDTVREAGAKGACVMSGLMACEDVPGYFRKFDQKEEAHGI
ncbi:MAG TPA: thiamine phosphate synthase [Candidatus Merdivicinus intestinigallinarum]|nr:thiamine phosphate synthase [Candidatus Merdivicinus intestinigallinarum]